MSAAVGMAAPNKAGPTPMPLIAFIPIDTFEETIYSLSPSEQFLFARVLCCLNWAATTSQTGQGFCPRAEADRGEDGWADGYHEISSRLIECNSRQYGRDQLSCPRLVQCSRDWESGHSHCAPRDPESGQHLPFPLRPNFRPRAWPHKIAGRRTGSASHKPFAVSATATVFDACQLPRRLGRVRPPIGSRGAGYNHCRSTERRGYG